MHKYRLATLINILGANSPWSGWSMSVMDLTRPLTGQCQYRGRMAQACLWFITIPSPGHFYGSLVNLNPQRRYCRNRR